MWITKDINIPDEIIDAQKKGELVIFAGAGVSTPSPSDLPNFEKLAKEISQGLIPFDNSISVDTYLGKLQNKGINVHKKTIEILTNPDSRPCSYHKNLLNLFSSDQIRIVTTNFDDHFRSVSNNEDIPFFSAPAVPLGRDFSGIVHLHGNVKNRPKDLVLTDSDFGKAYFTDGWATNFLRGLFANYVVLFIGFSASDPVMKYIARGLGSNNRNRYAFTEEGHSDHWEHLQIKNIEYPQSRHDLLEQAIMVWVDRINMGAFEQRRLIKDIAEKPPELNGVEESYILGQLSDELGAQHYFDFAKDYKWVEWMDTHNKLEPIFINQILLTPFMHRLANWFSSFVNIDSEKMMKMIMEKNSINDFFIHYIVRELRNQKDDLSSKLLGKWLTVYLGHINHHKKEDHIDYFVNGLNYPKNKELILVLFEYLTRPVTKYEKKFTLTENAEEFVDIKIELQGDIYWLEKLWKNTILPHLDYYAIPIINILISHLQMVTYLLKATGHENWDPVSFSRSAIEPHEQDNYRKEMDIIIDGCRDAIEYIIKNNSKLATEYIKQCFTSESKILRRISIHSLKFSEDIDTNQKLKWITKNNLLFDLELKHEVYQLIKLVYPNLDTRNKERFLDYIKTTFETKQNEDSINKESFRYEEFNLYFWLTLSDGNCELAHKYFNQAKENNMSFDVREYPDFTHWSSSGEFKSFTSSVNDINILSKDPNNDEDFEWLLTYQDNNDYFDNRDAFINTVSFTIESNNNWGWKLLNKLCTSSKYRDSDLWCAILKGYNQINLKEKELFTLSKAILDYCDLNKFRFFIANFYEHQTSIMEFNIQLSIDVIIQVFEKMISSMKTSNTINTEDIYTQAINHPIGKFTEFFLSLFIKGNNNKQIQDKIKNNVFLKLLGRNNEHSIMGKLILTNRLHVLMNIDESWSIQNIIPLFDARIDKELSKEVWNSYVYGGRWNERILKSLFPCLKSILLYTNELKNATQKGIFQICSSILFYSSEYNKPLIEYFYELGIAQNFELMTFHISNILPQLEQPVVEKVWKDWLKDYITSRLDNIPVPMNETEFSKIITLLPFLEPNLEEFVNLIISSNRQVNLVDSHIFYEISNSKLGEKFPQLLLSYLEFILKDMTIEFYYYDDAFEIMNQIHDSLNEKDARFKAVCEYLMAFNIKKSEETLKRYQKKFG